MANPIYINIYPCVVAYFCTFDTFYFHQRLLGKVLKKPVEKLTAGCQHCFMGPELVSCN